MRRMVLLFVLAAIPAAIPAAHAHPFTLETWPGGGVNGEAGTTQVWVRYSEEVEPGVQLAEGVRRGGATR